MLISWEKLMLVSWQDFEQTNFPFPFPLFHCTGGRVQDPHLWEIWTEKQSTCYIAHFFFNSWYLELRLSLSQSGTSYIMKVKRLWVGSYFGLLVNVDPRKLTPSPKCVRRPTKHFGDKISIILSRESDFSAIFHFLLKMAISCRYPVKWPKPHWLADTHLGEPCKNMLKWPNR